MMAWRANQLRAPDFALIRRSGARLYRFNLVTSNEDDGEPGIETANYDRLIRAGVTNDIEFLPVLLRSRAGRIKGKPKQVGAPPEGKREYATWRTRVRAFAERYGPEGEYWRQNPDLPYRPLRVWEVWNEPNLRQFWDGRPAAPREYGRLLVETRRVLRSVDPQARIVSAGVAARYKGAAYLREALDEAGGCNVDAIGIHPYAKTTKAVMDHLVEAREVADAAGARGVPLWTTEIGWRVGGRGYSTVPNARVQAREYRNYIRATERRRDGLDLGPSLAFALRDRVDEKTGKVDHTAGLRRADDRPRPAWAVWTRAARQAAPLPLPKVRRCR